MTSYEKYRGKCKEYCEEAVKQDTTLRLARGWYYEPLWNREEEHWWCVRKDGSIHDPTAKQFPSGGEAGFYREYDGIVKCAECGKLINENELQEQGKQIIMQGNYPVCSCECALRLVGV